MRFSYCYSIIFPEQDKRERIGRSVKTSTTKIGEKISRKNKHVFGKMVI